MKKENKEQCEVIELERVLEKLCQLFQVWGLSSDDWCLVGEWALVLQGFNIKGRRGVLDVYVNRDSFPFKVKDERQVVPPRDSKYFDEWVKFTADKIWVRYDSHP